MDFRHVRAFIAVADALSVTKAAERLHISQPPLSRHLHQLEQELGVTLFVRHRQGVTLTDAGRRLLDKARMLDSLAGEFYEAARRAAGGESSTIRVGIGWGLWDTVNRIRVEFARDNPDVTIEATDAYCWYDSDEKLRNGSLDVAFARPPYDPAFHVSPPIFHERFQAVVSDTSPLARRGSVWIREIAHEPLLLWDRQIAPVLYDKILDLYAHADVTPRIVATGGNGPFNHAGIMLVASGKGIYVGYGAPLITNPASGVAVLTVNDPDASIEICVVHRRGEVAPMVSRFMESVWRVFSQEQRVPAEVA